ncbi:MAG: hypothetical protein JW820_19410, partial [Spirochaetales bacterium]|nr:hypothetical protein [Spirochaetales bacterium]
MFSGGYMGKVLRVDLSRRSYQVQSLEDRLLHKLLGGRGVAAWMYYQEIGPEVDPLSPENKVFFMTGPLTGVRLPSTTKFQLATKGAETRMYLCSNGGGDFGPRLKQAGYDGLVIEGQADEWTYLTIRDGEIGFHDARPWKGLDSEQTLGKLYEAIGENKAAAMAIGPAGEKLVRLAHINVDHRAFGRGGAGAVLGSKRLKGIAVFGSGTIPVAEPEAVQKVWKEASKELQTTRANHKKYGTAQYIEVINELGCM